MRMCTLCGGLPYIKINILNYCNFCFTKMFESKIYKNISGMPFPARVLINIDNASEVAVVLHVLNKNKKTNHHSFYLQTTDKELLYNLYSKFPCLRLGNKLENGEKQDKLALAVVRKNLEAKFGTSEVDEILQNITDNNANVFVYGRTIEHVCARIFHTILNGTQIQSRDSDEICEHGNCRFINILNGIGNKELLYYSFLHDCQILANRRNSLQNKLHQSVTHFVSEISRNNALALFNVVSTVKKLKKPDAQTDGSDDL